MLAMLSAQVCLLCMCDRPPSRCACCAAINRHVALAGPAALYDPVLVLGATPGSETPLGATAAVPYIPRRAARSLSAAAEQPGTGQQPEPLGQPILPPPPPPPSLHQQRHHQRHHHQQQHNEPAASSLGASPSLLSLGMLPADGDQSQLSFGFSVLLHSPPVRVDLSSADA